MVVPEAAIFKHVCIFMHSLFIVMLHMCDDKPTRLQSFQALHGAVRNYRQCLHECGQAKKNVTMTIDEIDGQPDCVQYCLSGGFGRVSAKYDLSQTEKFPLPMNSYALNVNGNAVLSVSLKLPKNTKNKKMSIKVVSTTTPGSWSCYVDAQQHNGLKVKLRSGKSILFDFFEVYDEEDESDKADKSTQNNLMWLYDMEPAKSTLLNSLQALHHCGIEHVSGDASGLIQCDSRDIHRTWTAIENNLKAAIGDIDTLILRSSKSKKIATNYAQLITLFAPQTENTCLGENNMLCLQFKRDFDQDLKQDWGLHVRVLQLACSMCDKMRISSKQIFALFLKERKTPVFQSLKALIKERQEMARQVMKSVHDIRGARNTVMRHRSSFITLLGLDHAVRAHLHCLHNRSFDNETKNIQMSCYQLRQVFANNQFDNLPLSEVAYKHKLGILQDTLTAVQKLPQTDMQTHVDQTHVDHTVKQDAPCTATIIHSFTSNLRTELVLRSLHVESGVAVGQEFDFVYRDCKYTPLTHPLKWGSMNHKTACVFLCKKLNVELRHRIIPENLHKFGIKLLDNTNNMSARAKEIFINSLHKESQPLAELALFDQKPASTDIDQFLSSTECVTGYDDKEQVKLLCYLLSKAPIIASPIMRTK